jgi:hypothetical protein
LVPDLKVAPFQTSKNIASAWVVEIGRITTELPKIPVSLAIKSSSTLLFFRDFFVHLDLIKRTFELPSPEVWVSENNKLIDNLAAVLVADIANIKELIDFEKGLRFAVLKLKELVTAKFEYLANPYYLQNNDLEATNDLAEELSRLTDELSEIDGKSHSKLHDKMLKSFNNVKLRWEKVHESGTLVLHKVDAKRFSGEIADRHFGFVGNP